ncbi:MAG: Imidazole glycerol phosphate synthase, glutamine amidotransferase subunit [uncultured bacterium]|nr:MAG: Imidazole glycerol phosphate synthase, glutamine amidotransferase subunit [uncultured bacterium]
MITILDYDMGNISSIQNMINYLGYDSVLSSRKEDLIKAEKIILPGVGAFNEGMYQLKKLGLIEILNERVLIDRIPILGICLGIQLFTRKSEEGNEKGLGWIDSETKKFCNMGALKIPHMGWNSVFKNKDNKLIEGLDEKARFYFVHSYHVVCNDNEDVLLTTCYGKKFVSAIQKDNIYGTQFHPEKSHKFGMTILKNFCELN